MVDSISFFLMMLGFQKEDDGVVVDATDVWF